MYFSRQVRARPVIANEDRRRDRGVRLDTPPMQLQGDGPQYLDGRGLLGRHIHERELLRPETRLLPRPRVRDGLQAAVTLRQV